MIPIYFPFTYVSQPTSARLGRWFHQLGLLAPAADPPSPPGPESLAWRLFSPPPGDEALLGGLEAEWRRWAEMHTGAGLAAVMAAREADGPFSMTPAISSLRSRIRAGAAGQSAGGDTDPLLADRVFLRLAHGLDQDQDALRAQLDQVADLERQMRRQLDGGTGAPPAASGSPPGEDPGGVLTERRLAAWARLALALEVAAEVLVTDSPAVMAALAESVGSLDPVQALCPDEARRLPRALTEALGSDTGTAVTVHAVGLPPAAFLQRLAAGPRGPMATTTGPGGCLLVYLEPIE
jgi:hypothetical protein